MLELGAAIQCQSLIVAIIDVSCLFTMEGGGGVLSCRSYPVALALSPALSITDT